MAGWRKEDAIVATPRRKGLGSEPGKNSLGSSVPATVQVQTLPPPSTIILGEIKMIRHILS